MHHSTSNSSGRPGATSSYAGASGRKPTRSPPSHSPPPPPPLPGVRPVAPFTAPSLAALSSSTFSANVGGLALQGKSSATGGGRIPVNVGMVPAPAASARAPASRPSGSSSLSSSQARISSAAAMRSHPAPSAYGSGTGAATAGQARVMQSHAAASSSMAAASLPASASASTSNRRPAAASSSSARTSASSSSSSSKSSSSASSAASRSGPSAALIAAALQNQFMSSIKINSGTGSTAQSALQQAKKKAAASLAQQLGLVPAPAPKLTSDEWTAVREKAKARGDVEHSEACPICQEEFKTQDQVLLSCSHVFHKICLTNFERFSGTKVCPIWSKEYEKKLINDAKVGYRETCAIRIQSRFRGYLVRKQYLLMLETIPPKDAVKRKEFFMTKLTRTSTKLEQLMVHRDSAIDALFSELDRSVAQVRDSLSAAEVQLKAFSEEEWTGIRKQAERRDESECPICCSAFERTVKAKQARGGMDDYDEDDYDAEPSAASSSHTAAATAVPSYDSIGKREVLLSCSHVFHHSCLLSFERFTIASTALEGGGQGVNETLQKQQKRLEALDAGGEDGDAALLQPPPACLCPLCRSNYQKVWF